MTSHALQGNQTVIEAQAQYFKVMAKLASSGLFEDYMIYEQSGECWFGGGVLRSVTVYADRVESNYLGQVTIKKASGYALLTALNESLFAWEGKWQASGWACFLAQALTPKGHLVLQWICGQPRAAGFILRDTLQEVFDRPEWAPRLKDAPLRM